MTSRAFTASRPAPALTHVSDLPQLGNAGNPSLSSRRKSPWEARWYVGRRLKSRFFATEKERDKFVRDFKRDLQSHGKGIFEVDPTLIREWQEAHAILPHIKPMHLVEHWLNTHQECEERTISEAAKAYLKIMELAGRDPAYRKHCKVTLQRFGRFCNNCHVREVTAAQVAAFVHETPHSPTTKRHWRRDLNTAFKWFLKQQWTDVNPVDAVPVPKIVLPEPGILKVEEAEALFRANEEVDPGICGLLALGAFAGMRSSAICRLDHSELDFKNRAILTPAAKTKKGRRHFIEGLPDNLWSWLERTPAAAFQMTQREFARRREAAFARAGLLVSKAAAKASKGKLQAKAPPKNCLRHSFVSYHVALHRDPGKTTLLVSHKDQAILWDHYLGVATAEDAGRYFGIKPLKWRR